MNAAIPLIAGFGLLAADRQLLAVADRRKTAGRDAERHQVILRGFRATRAEREVVLDGAALIAMPFDLGPGARVLLQPGGVRAQHVTRLAVDLRRVVREVNVLQDAA